MFDITLLKTFLAVADARHFTAASRGLGLSQSTVSQHIRRLELASGRQLLARDTHAVTLTADGALMAGFARDIVQASQRAADYFADSAPRGRVRFGVSEDLTLTRLPTILREFMAASPLLNVELSVGLTAALHEKLDAGRLDLVFAKRLPGEDRGEVIWREALAWMGAADVELDPNAPVPLAAYTCASITSSLAVDALNAAGRAWVVTCSSETLSGMRAAALAGLGITAQSRLLLQQGDLVELSKSAGLPPLGEVEFVVVGRSARLHGGTAALAEVIRARGAELWSDV